MPHKADNPQKPLFLTSPPGNQEAADIGYINIPKIVKEPPPELGEVQEFSDNTGFLYSNQDSNAWVLKSHIENIVRSSNIVSPIIPEIFQYAIKWIVCEYGLHLMEDIGDKENLMLFTKNVIGRRLSDWPQVGMALFEKRWRGAEKPIHYLRVVAKRKKSKDYSVSKSLFGDKILSFEGAIITGDIVASLIGGGESDRGVSTQKKNLVSEFREVERSLEGDFGILEEKSEISIKDSKRLEWEEVSRIPKKIIRKADLYKICEMGKLSSNATKMLVDAIENITTYSDSAAFLGLTEKESNAARREITRKKPALQKLYRKHMDNS